MVVTCIALVAAAAALLGATSARESTPLPTTVSVPAAPVGAATPSAPSASRPLPDDDDGVVGPPPVEDEADALVPATPRARDRRGDDTAP